MLKVQINIVVLILIVMLFIHASWQRDNSQRVNRLYLLLLFFTAIILILEILNFSMEEVNGPIFVLIHKLVIISGITLASSIAYTGNLFIKEWARKYKQVTSKTSYYGIIVMIINMVMMVVMVVYKGELFFSINSENVYTRGPLFYIPYLISCSYFAYTIAWLWKRKSDIGYKRSILWILVYFLSPISAFVQFETGVYLTIWSSIGLILIINYICLLTYEMEHDILTGLKNRFFYEKYITCLMNKKELKLSIISIDIDEFKMINDTYGHQEGDRALRIFAILLRRAFKSNNKIIRLGGDEFLVFIEESNIEKIKLELNELNNYIEQYNDYNKKNYKLKFSYGLATFDEECDDINDFLGYADELMYKHKREKN